MMYKTNKKQQRSAKDNSAVDSFAVRKARTAKLRNIIRTCFYLHCIGAAVCIALSIIFSAGFDIVKICVCAVTSVIFAFFAVGDLTHVKTISCVIDFTFAAAAFVSAVLDQNRLLYLICGGIMTILGIAAIISSIAAAKKRALDNISPFMLRREKRPQQNTYSAYPDYDDIPDLPDDYVIETPVSTPTQTPSPQPYENMHKLAKEVSEILCGETTKTGK